MSELFNLEKLDYIRSKTTTFQACEKILRQPSHVRHEHPRDAVLPLEDHQDGPPLLSSIHHADIRVQH